MILLKEVISSRDAVVVSLRLVAGVPEFDGGPPVHAAGAAKRHPSDRFDRRVGEALAIGRALQVLGRRLERRAKGVVKHRDDMREQRRRQTAAQGA